MIYYNWFIIIIWDINLSIILNAEINHINLYLSKSDENSEKIWIEKFLIKVVIP